MVVLRVNLIYIGVAACFGVLDLAGILTVAQPQCESESHLLGLRCPELAQVERMRDRVSPGA
jgi:hypothetical protein